MNFWKNCRNFESWAKISWVLSFLSLSFRFFHLEFMSECPKKAWEPNLYGKSLISLVQKGTQIFFFQSYRNCIFLSTIIYRVTVSFLPWPPWCLERLVLRTDWLPPALLAGRLSQFRNWTLGRAWGPAGWLTPTAWHTRCPDQTGCGCCSHRPQTYQSSPRLRKVKQSEMKLV